MYIIRQCFIDMIIVLYDHQVILTTLLIRHKANVFVCIIDTSGYIFIVYIISCCLLITLIGHIVVISFVYQLVLCIRSLSVAALCLLLMAETNISVLCLLF